MGRHQVGTRFIVITTVLGTSDNALPLLAMLPNKVDLRVVEDLLLFEFSQFTGVKLQSLFGSEVALFGGLGCADC